MTTILSELNPTVREDLKDIIEKCIENDRKAQRELYNLFSPMLYGICLKYMKNEHDAKDVFQEAFVVVFQKMNQFKFEGSFEGWIKRLFINRLIETIKKNKRNIFLLDLANISEDELDDKEDDYGIDCHLLLKYVQDLPDQYRLVFNLYVFENMKHKEIAELLEISEGTSKSNLNRAKSHLRKRINSELNYKTA